MPVALNQASRLPLRAGSFLALGFLLLLFAGSAHGRSPRAGTADGPLQAPAAPRTWVVDAVRSPSYDPTSLLDPRGVAAGPGSTFLVADLGHHRVVTVGADGAVLRAFGQGGDGPTGLEQPTDLAVDANRDRVYVADYGNRRVSVFTLEGAPVEHWRRAGPGQAFAPYAVAVAPTTGEVYVISRLTGGRVERFDADGAWLSGWGAPGTDPGQFNAPEDLAVDASGRVLVADTNNGRIQVFASDGTHQASWSGLAGVRDVAVAPESGTIHALVGNDEIRVFLPNGTPLRAIRAADLGVDFRPAARIAVGPGGRLAVATGPGAADGRQGLRQFATDDTIVSQTLADPLAHPGFVEAAAIDAGPDGSLYVTDAALEAGARYAPDGALVQRLREASGIEVTVGPGGTVHVADRWARLRTLAADGRVTSERTCDCFVGMGLAADDDRVFVTEALTRAIGVLPPAPGPVEPHPRLRLADPPYAWPMDLSLGPDGRLYAAGGDNGRVDVLDPASGPVGAFPVGGGGAERVSVAADGTVFVLRYDGSLAAFSPDGAREAEWRPEPVPGAGRVDPADLAAGPGGRLYVLDDVTGSILVYEAVSAPPPTATPESTPTSPCTVVGDKTAGPTIVRLGEEVTLRLSLDIQCPAGSEARADVVLVLDRSNSMAGLKLGDAKRAAEVFADGLDLTRHRVGLVSFSDTAALEQPLTGDGAAVRRAIQGVQAHGTTDIGAALERASRHLAEAARPDALGVVLLLTDGEPTGSRQAYADAVRRAARARARGTLVYAVGLGANVDEALLATAAGGASRYFFAPEAAQLEPIYRDLSRAVGAVVATDVRVVDELGPDVAFVPGSASGQPIETGRRVTWALGAVPQGGLPELSLRVTPQKLGRLPTNASAVAGYTASGVRYEFVFPVPEIEVVDRPPATATQTASPTPTPTVSPTTAPARRTAYLPYALKPTFCPPDRRKPADIVLVIDTSTSMSGDKLTRAVTAAGSFLDLVSPERDRVGLMAFHANTRLTPLAAGLPAVRRDLAALEVAEGTRIDLALYETLREFYYNGRPEAAHVAILLSDGRPQPGTDTAAREQAALMRDAYGVTLFVIGLGADADGALLRALAASPDAYYHAPGPGDLAAIYERIAVRLPCR